jgi:hypothetical protein
MNVVTLVIRGWISDNYGGVRCKVDLMVVVVVEDPEQQPSVYAYYAEAMVFG